MRFCKSCDDWGFPRHSAVIVSESAEMGRKAKYLIESVKKKAKREKRTVGLQKSIYLGKVFVRVDRCQAHDRSVIRPSR